MPRVSVVIPCFNLGEYILEAIESVKTQTFQDFEIIVINDGSTDIITNQIISAINEPNIRVLNTSNQGLSIARNTAIDHAIGEYILPLDADDKIGDSYLEKAVKILDKNKNIGIVYCEAKFFGKNTSEWILPRYKLSKILLDNMIFSSAFFRRHDWERVTGYKPTMIYGWEDYDFWLSLIELGREVYKIPECLFFYRKRTDSMTDIMSREHMLYSYKEIVTNHKQLYLEHIEYIFEHIYCLRDLIKHEQSENSSKDAQIVLLESKISESNSRIIELNSKINELISQIAELEKQISNIPDLIKLFSKSILKKIISNCK